MASVEALKSGSVERVWTAPAEAKADAAPGEGGDDEDDIQPPDVQSAGRRDETRADEQRVTGQEEPDQQPGLGEHDRRQNDVAAPADEIEQCVAAGQ